MSILLSQKPTLDPPFYDGHVYPPEVSKLAWKFEIAPDLLNFSLQSSLSLLPSPR